MASSSTETKTLSVGEGVAGNKAEFTEFRVSDKLDVRVLVERQDIILRLKIALAPHGYKGLI